MAWREIIYQYDGSFEGLLCCVFESYTKKERPTAILRDGDDEPSLFEIRAVMTDRAHAQRIYRSLYKRSPEVGPFLRRAFLTCLPDKEMAIYRFIVKFYREGAPLLSRLSDDTYLPLLKAVPLEKAQQDRHFLALRELVDGFAQRDALNEPVLWRFAAEHPLERQAVARFALQAVRRSDRQLTLRDLLGIESRLLRKLGERWFAPECIFELFARGEDRRRLLTHAAAHLDCAVIAQKASNFARDLRHSVG